MTTILHDTTDLAVLCLEQAKKAREAALQLSTVRSAAKDRWLLRVADRLMKDQAVILQANQLDVEKADQYGLTRAQMDRLTLTPNRLEAAATGLREVAALPDPVGKIESGYTRPNGLEIQKVRVPLGVIFFIYESRPNVTLDAAGLCLKSGNSVILRGGKEAIHSNLQLYRLLADCLEEEGLPREAIQIVSSTDRAAVGHLLKLDELIDVVIPRGGEDLIRRVVAEARMPVLKHYKGICHVYVDRAADLNKASKIVVNAKCQRPGVCNATECLLVDRTIAAEFLPSLARQLLDRGVEIRGCEQTCALVAEARPADPEDYDTEFLDLILAVRVVEGLDEAIQHINTHGSRHTDAIVTNDLASARKFTSEVDTAAVMVNASTRFHDGFELGLGGEIGISTDKIHARGPCGLLELTSYKYVVHGDGHVRGE